jgi:hypothetical protein
MTSFRVTPPTARVSNPSPQFAVGASTGNLYWRAREFDEWIVIVLGPASGNTKLGGALGGGMLGADEKIAPGSTIEIVA